METSGVQEEHIQQHLHNEFIAALSTSKYFEIIKGTQFFTTRISRMLEQGRVVPFNEGDVVCEYGTKSNMIFFLLSGSLSVFIPKDEFDVKEQLRIVAVIEKTKRALKAKDGNTAELTEQLHQLEEEWEQVKARFDTRLIDECGRKRKSEQQQHHGSQQSAYSMMKNAGDITVGNCFGEVGAILDKPRTATIISREASHCLLLPFRKFAEIFAEEQIYELNFRVLNLMTLFPEQKVGPHLVAHLASHFVPVNQTKVLFREGEAVNGVYLIQHGDVEITRKRGGQRDDGEMNSVRIGIKGKGSLIGIEDYYNYDKQRHHRRANTAIFKDYHVIAYRIDQSTLDAFLAGYGNFRSVFIQLATILAEEYNHRFSSRCNLHSNFLKTPMAKSSIEGIPPSPTLQHNTSISKLKHFSSIERLASQPTLPQPDSQTGFPEMIRFEKSKRKDFMQNYEIYKKQVLRPEKPTLAIGGKYEAFMRKTFQKDFINNFNAQKESINKPTINYHPVPLTESITAVISPLSELTNTQNQPVRVDPSNYFCAPGLKHPGQNTNQQKSKSLRNLFSKSMRNAYETTSLRHITCTSSQPSSQPDLAQSFSKESEANSLPPQLEFKKHSNPVQSEISHSFNKSIELIEIPKISQLRSTDSVPTQDESIVMRHSMSYFMFPHTVSPKSLSFSALKQQPFISQQQQVSTPSYQSKFVLFPESSTKKQHRRTLQSVPTISSHQSKEEITPKAKTPNHAHEEDKAKLPQSTIVIPKHHSSLSQQESITKFTSDKKQPGHHFESPTAKALPYKVKSPNMYFSNLFNSRINSSQQFT